MVRKHVWVLGVAAALAAPVWAQQVNVKLALAYNTFLMGEAAVTQVELENLTSGELRVGGANANADLLVEMTRDGQHEEVFRFNEKPFVKAFRLAPGERYTRMVELDKWFRMLDEGKYFVQVAVHVGGMRYTSPKKALDVVQGIPVMQGVQMFVSRPELKRIFRLVYWHRNQTNRLVLRILDEPDERTWDSIDLGAFMKDERPKLDIAPDGEVTVVFRQSQDVFIRTVLWSVENAVDVVERNTVLDPNISASQRVKSLYGEMSTDAEKNKRPWWKLW